MKIQGHIKRGEIYYADLNPVVGSELRIYIGHLYGNSMIMDDNALSISVGLQGVPNSKCFIDKRENYKSGTTGKNQIINNRMEALYE